MGQRIDRQITLVVVEGRIAGRSALAHNRVARFLPCQAIVVGPLKMNQSGVSGIVVRDINMRPVGSSPGPVRSRGVDDLPFTPCDVEAWVGDTWAGDRRNTNLDVSKRGIEKEYQRCGVQRARRADVDVRIARAENGLTGLLQRGVNHALELRGYTKRPCPKIRAERRKVEQPLQPDHRHRAIARNRDLWLAVSIRPKERRVRERQRTRP